MKKAFFVVGHSHWGKSETLKILTGGNHRIQKICLDGFNFRVKHMSNDDEVDSVLRFVNNALRKGYKNIIMALCPNFEDEENGTTIVLDKLDQEYELYFFVLKQKYGHNDVITEMELENLKKWGHVYEYDKQQASDRCQALKEYIMSKM